MRRSEVQFRFEGKPMSASDGDTVAAALIANGVFVFGRSSKYHRPRGYRCGQGHCSACAMRVDGLSGVRTCMTRVRPGMVVEREHAFPSADRDLLRVAELLSPLTPPGFYYRWFRRSPYLWKRFERGLARLAGQGRLPSSEAALRLGRTRCEHRDGPEVLVVGGGVAGLSAAASAAGTGAKVLLVERDERLGGRSTGADGFADELADEVARDDRVEALTGAEAIGWYDEGVVTVDRSPDLLILTPATVVLATGGYDVGLPFPNWDLPGVMFAEAAERLVARYGVRPGSRAVVITTSDAGYQTGCHLLEAGVEIACIADCRQRSAVQPRLLSDLTRQGIRIVFGADGATARGRGRVEALSVQSFEADRANRHECDLVCISAGIRPADDLAYQAMSGGSLVLSTSDPPPQVPGLWLAGLVTGEATSRAACKQGRRAGASAGSRAASREPNRR